MIDDRGQLIELIDAFLGTDNWEAAAAWLRATPEADERFVAALIELTDGHRLRGSPSDARYLGQHALLAAQLKGLPVHAGMSSLLLGLLERHLGQLNQARDFFAEAARLFEQEQNNLGLANTIMAQGDLDRHLGRVAQAEQRYEQAAELFTKEQNNLGLANTIMAQGDLALIDDARAAERLYAEAARLYEDEQDGLGLSNTLHSQARAALRGGEVSKVHGLLEQALARISIDGQPVVPWNAGLVLTTWAQSHLLSREWDSAWERARQAVVAFEGIATLLPTPERRAEIIEQAAEAYAAAVTAALGRADQAEAARRPEEAARRRLEAWQTAEEGKTLPLQALLGNPDYAALHQRYMTRATPALAPSWPSWNGWRPPGAHCWKLSAGLTLASRGRRGKRRWPGHG